MYCKIQDYEKITCKKNSRERSSLYSKYVQIVKMCEWKADDSIKGLNIDIRFRFNKNTVVKSFNWEINLREK